MKYKARIESEVDLPLVSFMLPAYNHEKFIVQTLESFTNDQYPNKELIVINDGSTDNTRQLIQNWIDKNNEKHSIIFINQSNQGIAATLNKIESLASGKFLRMASSDDLFSQLGTLQMANALIANPAKKAAIGDCLVVDDNDKVIEKSLLFSYHKSKKKNYFNDNNLKFEIIAKWAVGGPTLLIERDYFSKIKYTNELHIEDWDFFLRLVADNTIVFIDKIVGSYRIHHSNTSRTREINKRIFNLQQQSSVALKNLSIFKGPYRTLLLAEYYLYNAKVAFLKRSPFQFFIKLTSFIILRCYANLCLFWNR